MSEQPGLGSLTSKKGWVSIGYDRTIWIPCLAIFPEGCDRESYAAQFAQLWWDASGLRYGPADLARLAAMISEIHQGIYGHIPCHLAFIHLPDPRLMPLVLYVGIWESDGERDAQLRMLTHADDPGAVEPPIVDEFTTDRLGTGLRTMRYRHLGDGSLYAGLSYAWRCAEYETDVLLFTSSEDLGRLQRAIPDMDEFARAVNVISREELHD
jgi:hypothetical protein